MEYGPMTTARVLLVDDNPERLELLAGRLSEHYMVSSYGSASEALREAGTATTDVVLLVITSPISDHRELLTVIDEALAGPETGLSAAPPVNPPGRV
jgi:DNA-binding response OmpR family regulator